MTSGYTIGFNLSEMTYTISGKDIPSETMTGIHFGRIYDMPVKRNLSLQSGFIFTAKGSILKNDTSDFSLSPIYFEVPVHAFYSFGPEFIKISLFGGPYIACGIGGRIESGGESFSIRYGSGEGKDIRLLDMGFVAGAGLSIKGFMISAQYESGLVNISPRAKSDSEIRNNLISISITSLFEGK